MTWNLFIGATAPVIAILVYLYYKDKHVLNVVLT